MLMFYMIYRLDNKVMTLVGLCRLSNEGRSYTFT